jgi:precorrin-3B synthase
VTSAALDACPGLLALHPARDGYVARIRLPGGYASGPRWRALAGLAATFGDGCLDLTSRGNVQLRGLRATDGATLARRAASAGLLPSAAHDRARNIMASPLAGLGGRAALRGLVRRLDAVLLSDPGFAALPGRFLFAVDDGSGGAGLAGCDVGLRRRGGGVEVIVAGRLTGVRVPVAAGVPVAAASARAAIARGVGASATRIAELPDGGESVAAAIGGALGGPAATTDTRLPLGRAAPDVTGSRATRRDDETIVLAAPLGRLSAAQALLIANLLRPREIVRMGIAGRLVLPLAPPAWPGATEFVPAAGPLAAELVAAEPAGAEPAGAGLAGAGLAGAGPAGAGPAGADLAGADLAGAAIQRLADAGLVMAEDAALAGVTACSGAACSRSVADVRAVAGPVPGHPRTHWAGCARQCGRPPDAEAVIAIDARRFQLSGQDEPQSLATLTGAA